MTLPPHLSTTLKLAGALLLAIVAAPIIVMAMLGSMGERR